MVMAMNCDTVYMYLTGRMPQVKRKPITFLAKLREVALKVRTITSY